jgi:hypothetical protein
VDLEGDPLVDAPVLVVDEEHSEDPTGVLQDDLLGEALDSWVGVKIVFVVVS